MDIPGWSSFQNDLDWGWGLLRLRLGSEALGADKTTKKARAEGSSQQKSEWEDTSIPQPRAVEKVHPGTAHGAPCSGGQEPQGSGPHVSPQLSRVDMAGAQQMSGFVTIL